MKRLGFKKSVDLSGINERIGTSESKIANLERTTSDNRQAIATAQSELTAKFDNLAVGGRNYFKKSSVVANLRNTATKTADNGIIINATNANPSLTRINRVIDEVADWTVSFEAKANTPCSLFVDICDQNRTTHQLTTEFKKYITIGRPARIDNTYHFVDIETQAVATIEIKNIKIEKGTIPTDWTPAPEDYTAGLAIYNTTTAQSPNVFVSDTGQLQRSTSSERYKEIISPLVLDDKAYKNAMKLNPIIYRSTAEADKQDWHYYSFSAEQLGQFDKAFTLWRTPTETIIDDNGEITITELEPIAEGINLNAIVAFLHATNVKQGMLIRDLTKRIEFLENQRDK